jgi:hypothetical protein
MARAALLVSVVSASVLLRAAGAAAYVYWTDNVSTTIGRADLDGTQGDPSFVSGASQPLGVAVDGQQIYWSNHADGTIGVANLVW